VSVWNRTPERARELATALGARAADGAPEPTQIVVNATSIGLHAADDVGELPLAALGAPEVAVDLVYRPGEGRTPFERWALERGAVAVPGIEILVHQGALSFERWTGRRPPLDAMRSAARGEISPAT
jgi:shikimate dehydrogenase